MKKELFSILFHLARNQPWLSIKNKVSLLENLLFEDCNTDAERDLVIDLINRFTYVDSEKYSQLISEIALGIITDPDLDDSSTIIAAMSIGHGADSGQATLYALKNVLQENKWEQYGAINDAHQVYRCMNKNDRYQNIVLVDEFVGSGVTVLGRVKAISQQFLNNKKAVPLIKVRVLVSTNQGICNVRESGVDIESLILLDKGISDYYDDKEDKIAMMKKLESILSEEYNGRHMPTLGSGEAEALYYRHEANLPNSVFPIFWWNEYRNGNQREVLLHRAMEFPDD